MLMRRMKINCTNPCNKSSDRVVNAYCHDRRYVGLVSGACFSDFGHHVICIDSDEEKIAALKSGKIPIHEPGLADLVASNVRQGRLAFGNDMKSAVGDAAGGFIPGGGPARGGEGET